jgi:hypothetical protein
MVKYVVLFGIATLCIVWIPLGVLALRLRQKVGSLRAQVEALQNQVEELAERNFHLLLKPREGAPGPVSTWSSPKYESAEVHPLKSPPVTPSLVGSG